MNHEEKEEDGESGEGRKETIKQLEEKKEDCEQEDGVEGSIKENVSTYTCCTFIGLFSWVDVEILVCSGPAHREELSLGFSASFL